MFKCSFNFRKWFKSMSAKIKLRAHGYKWMKIFLKHNCCTMKKAEMISTARIVNTSNPFIIYNFYDTFERASTLSSLSETYLEPCQTSKTGPFLKMINCFLSLNFFAKKTSLDVSLGCEYATDYDCQSAIKQTHNCN